MAALTADLPVLIAGAGIGGLTAAIALRQAGFAVRVFERAPELGEVGAGLTIQANAVLALRRLGLDTAVVAAGRTAGFGTVRTARGRVLSRLDLRQIEAALGAPMVAIHRATLQRLLLAALGPGTVELGREAVSWEEREGRVVLQLGDGGSAEGSVLVGADGLRSAVRARLLGDGAPLYAGYTCWRGVTAGGVQAGEVSESWGAGRRFGIVPIDGGRIYWFATRNAPPGGRDAPGTVRATLERLFTGWHPPVAAVLADTPEEAVLRNDILHRLPVHRWGAGRVTLLGDAAHPMTPNLGQGACQAIEDAVALAACLRAAAAPAQGLRTYEDRRRERANHFVRASLRLGRLAQWESAPARWLRDNLVALTPASLSFRQLVKTLRPLETEDFIGTLYGCLKDSPRDPLADLEAEHRAEIEAEERRQRGGR